MRQVPENSQQPPDSKTPAGRLENRNSRVLEVRELEVEEHPAWEALVTESPHGSIYAMPAYLEILCNATHGRFRILAVLRKDQILGGVPIYIEPSPFGLRVQPRLLLYYNGFVLREYRGKYPSQRTAQEIAVLSALEGELRQRRFSRLRLKSRYPLRDFRAFLDSGWRAQLSYTYAVPLGDVGALWDRTEENARRLVRRAERQGLSITEDDDFASFYRMHWGTHCRKGAPEYLPEPQFLAWFEALHALGLCRLYHARRPDGLSIASQLVLTGPHPVSHTVAAAADPEHLSSGSNAFLRWNVFEDLARRGGIENDLTDAAINPVTHFKSQLGGDLRMSITLCRPDPTATRFRSTVAQMAHVAHLARRAGRATLPKWVGR